MINAPLYRELCLQSERIVDNSVRCIPSFIDEPFPCIYVVLHPTNITCVCVCVCSEYYHYHGNGNPTVRKLCHAHFGFPSSYISTHTDHRLKLSPAWNKSTFCFFPLCPRPCRCSINIELKWFITLIPAHPDLPKPLSAATVACSACGKYAPVQIKLTGRASGHSEGNTWKERGVVTESHEPMVLSAGNANWNCWSKAKRFACMGEITVLFAVEMRLLYTYKRLHFHHLATTCRIYILF